MNKKLTATLLVDEHLESLQGMKEPVTDDFFYTRLKAKMFGRQKGKEKISMNWVYTTVAAMVLTIAVNVFAWRNAVANKQSYSIQKLVQEYGWASHDIYSDNSN